MVEYWCKILYKVSVTKTLCGDRNTIQMTKFLALHDSIGLPDTLKQYIVVIHVPEYFRHHNVSLRASAEEGWKYRTYFYNVSSEPEQI